MKKILAALVIAVYFVPIAVFLAFYMALTQETQDLSTLRSFFIPIVFMIIVCGLVIVNIAGAVYSLLRSQYLPFKSIMVMKLCLIPFYIMNFICWVFASIVFPIQLFVLPLIPFIIIYTYFTMIGTSVHIITKLIALRQRRIITIKQFIVHCIFQMTFAADVIDSITLAIKEKTVPSKKKEKSFNQGQGAL